VVSSKSKGAWLPVSMGLQRGGKMPFRMRTFTIALLTILVTFSQGDLMAGSLRPSHYERGHTVFVKSLKVNINGGLIRITNTGTALDGATIEIPIGALEKEVTLSIGYDTGIVNLNSGKGSGSVIVLTTTPDIVFKKPVKIKVRFDRNVNAKTIVGYEIDKQGRLHSIDIGSINNDSGVVSFYTFKPLIFTWIYI